MHSYSTYVSVLLTVLLLCGGKMEKATYQKKHMFRYLLRALEYESMIIMVGYLAAGRKSWYKGNS